MKLTKKIWFDENSMPPKDQIWYRGGGKFYEYLNGEWVVIYDLGNILKQEELDSISNKIEEQTGEELQDKSLSGVLEAIVDSISTGGTVDAESLSNKVQSLVGNEDSQTKYPSAKAVYDALNTKLSKPDTDGTFGQVLITDGQGNVSWQNAEAAGGLEYFNYYSNGINKEIRIVGVGQTGSGAGVQQVGDIFYNTSTGKLRRATSATSSGTFKFEDVDIDTNALYVSPIKMYRFVDGVFTEAQASSLGLLGTIKNNEETIKKITNKHLKICLLGNSYAADCWRYVPFMLLNYGITCEIYFYYRGSGSLNDLNSQWEDYGYNGIAESDGAPHSRLAFHIDTRINDKWIKYPYSEENGQTMNTICAKDIVEIGNTIGGWDLITLQQVSVFTDADPDDDTSERYVHLADIIDYIQDHCDNPFNLAWFQSYTRVAHDDATVRANSLENQHKLFKKYPFDFEIPVATAVFSARGNDTLSALGDSSEHNLWADDDVHLQEGLPCYLGSLVVLQSLFNYFGLGKSVLNDKFRATTENVGSGQIGMEPTAQFPCIGVTEVNCRLAQKAAILAVKNPSEISTI